MNGGILPSVLLCASLGLWLSGLRPRSILLSLATLCIVAGLTRMTAMSSLLADVALPACWISVIVMASLLHVPKAANPVVGLLLAANAGLWSATALPDPTSVLPLVSALSAALVVFPALLILRTPLRLGVKIVGSWLAAVAILAAAVPLVETPGYEPDHMQ